MPVLQQQLTYALILSSFLGFSVAQANAESASDPTPATLKPEQLAGKSMVWVEAEYGTPQQIRMSSGPIKPQWPLITVWDYGTFAVYFERKIVLHTVMR